jgi:hypothetical protein
MQQALISLGSQIAAGELFTATTAGTYGPSTHAAANALRVRFGVAAPVAVFNAETGRLLNIAVATEAGNTAALRQAVRESFAARQAAPAAGPVELGWVALYAVIALDFTTARSIAALIPGEPMIRDRVGPIVNRGTSQPPAPARVNPSNYYTVGYGYAPTSTIKSLIPTTPR